MQRAPRLAGVVVALGAVCTACGPKRIAAPARPGDAAIVLLPDTPGGTVGRIRITNPVGGIELSGARDSTSVATNEAPAAVTRLSESEIRRLFGEALEALPPPPRRFTLHFRFESDELTDESAALVPEILKTVKERSFPDVVVVGHTDTSGGSDANFALALRRATAVRTLLVGEGVDPSLIDVASHGEQDLLVKTADNTPEPRNRRVEIAVR
jgi:outer membrane protein OmpA-like peptidoglycan-associated protein